jgi:all-trans-8'-apo-beta-carotenal 15,15'-oxygenase
MTDHAPLLERAFAIDIVEDSYDIEYLAGTVPGYIRGSYYLNGPARFGRGKIHYDHWLDGDGMVTALQFGSGDVRCINRFVRSKKFVDEEDEGRSLYRGFGTSFEDDRLKRGIALESPVNVSVYPWQDTLLAFGEQGLPWELDPQTLATRGEYTFGGRLNALSPLSAHPRFDLTTGEMFNFGISFSARHPCLHLYRFAKDGELVYRKRIHLDFPCSVHDFILGPDYVVFYLSPFLLDMKAMMSGGISVMEALRWKPELGSRLVVVSRETGEAVTTIPVGHRYSLHLINCFQDGGNLVVDVIELERPVYDQYQVLPQLFIDAPAGRPVRRVIDLENLEVVEEQAIRYEVSQDFPSIDPRRSLRSYNDLWVLGISTTPLPGRKFFDELAHLSWDGEQDLYRAPAGCYFGGEPIFLGDPQDKNAGSVICQQFNADTVKSSFLVFDAYNVSEGPVAELKLKHPLPLSFHASFRGN